jgi:hypothetical protein
MKRQTRINADKRIPTLHIAETPNPRMQPTGRGGPALRSGTDLLEAK